MTVPLGLRLARTRSQRLYDRLVEGGDLLPALAASVDRDDAILSGIACGAQHSGAVTGGCGSERGGGIAAHSELRGQPA